MNLGIERILQVKIPGDGSPAQCQLVRILSPFGEHAPFTGVGFSPDGAPTFYPTPRLQLGLKLEVGVKSAAARRPSRSAAAGR